mmetsp:Transcript_41161/g.99171  ORF Transcript_41161/g.99171 Transcript_41161/m.99171 type:complete len:253 (+) Transcript_41161:399-1157(+)|eukprot:CAMPEP_0113637466 /NCGR_PEP_ID=MMETSP0017_2-20120614/19613_1 /TAXON_ID=2856 /ORGANISM="Cylindrotheca closterium" /LENGTH=252 /DNA_ID=CAMNT_0000548499 /DNA_START=184 /DNA_END=942 /DNA_ORIENTATION=+ /assembly_acc=CAM_ASM_000147
MNRSTMKLLAIACFLSATTHAFVTPQSMHNAMETSLFAKKKKSGAAGQGFGKEPVTPPTPPKSASSSSEPMMLEREDPSQQASAFTSVEGGSNAIPTLDPNLSPEERASAILRDQYGMRTREEQQEETRRAEAAKEQRKKLDDWKKQADAGNDFDIMQVLPAPVLIGIDRFLKVGVAVCTVLFVLAGIGITFEAWSKASDSPLPENIDTFIVNVIEPNFTPGLGVLLGFSISLGAFAAAQLSSSSATYRQDQ